MKKLVLVLFAFVAMSNVNAQSISNDIVYGKNDKQIGNVETAENESTFPQLHFEVSKREVKRSTKMGMAYSLPTAKYYDADQHYACYDKSRRGHNLTGGLTLEAGALLTPFTPLIGIASITVGIVHLSKANRTRKQMDIA